MKGAAVFLDPIETVFHGSPRRSEVTSAPAAPQSLDALRHLVGHGFAIVFLSDKPELASGQVSLAQVVSRQRAFTRRMKRAVVPIAGNYLCPHDADTGFACECRRPADGLFRHAIRDLAVDTQNSWWIGRKLVGMLAAQKVGLRTAMIGQEFASLFQCLPYPDMHASTFYHAAVEICRIEPGQSPNHDRKP